MADCGDYDYQAIAYRGLFDLKNAQIIRAQIDSIDPAGNTASVTLLDECPLDDWLDTDAVPFFYHCENSTGTVEDLENGYKAFAIGDMVYLLLNQEDGDNSAQAYVVGHVDIRDTKPCGSEFVAVTVTVVIDDEDVDVATIFNLSTGSVLDLASFENIDAGSPPKPAHIPFTVTNGWMFYNFGFSVAAGAMPFTITRYNTNSAYNDVPQNVTKTEDTDTPYTGQVSATLCADLSLGNGYAERTERWSGEYSSITGSLVNEYTSYIADNASKAIYSGSCRAWFGTSSFDMVKEHTYPASDIYFHIVDPVISSAVDITCKRYEKQEHHNSQTTSMGGTTCSVTYSLQVSYTFDYSAASGPISVASHSCHYSASGAFIGPESAFPTANSIADSGSCSMSPWGYYSLYPQTVSGLYGNINLFGGQYYILSSVGEEYICTVLGGLYYREVMVADTNAGSIPVAFNNSQYAGYPWGYMPSSGQVTASSRFEAAFTVSATVTGVQSMTKYGSSFSINECFNKANIGLSQGLSNAVEDIGTFIQGLLPADASYSVVNAAFQGLTSTGPRVLMLKKKT